MANQSQKSFAQKEPEERSIEEGVQMLFSEYPDQAENRLLTSDCTPHNPLHSTATEDDLAVPGERENLVENIVGHPTFQGEHKVKHLTPSRKEKDPAKEYKLA